MRRAKLNFEKHVDRLRKLPMVALLLTSAIFANPGMAQEKDRRLSPRQKKQAKRSTRRPIPTTKRRRLKSSGRLENRSSIPGMKPKMRRVALHS
jgi:hypothetical protein